MTSENEVFLKVWYTGAVLSEGELAVLFDPFTLMESKHENRNLAKGLGFYIAKGLIEDAHMGSFTLGNIDQEACCIILTIRQTA